MPSDPRDLDRDRDRDPDKQRARDRDRESSLKRNYGITSADYEAVLAHQDYRCAVCRRPASTYTKRLAVDHCHKTGLIRGLLCSTCNRGVAVFRDDVEKLQAAAAYLTSPPFTQARGETFTLPGRVGSKRRKKRRQTQIQT